MAEDDTHESRKRVTLADVARATGVSPAAVSLAVRGEPGVSRETRERVVETARQSGLSRRLALLRSPGSAGDGRADHQGAPRRRPGGQPLLRPGHDRHRGDLPDPRGRPPVRGDAGRRAVLPARGAAPGHRAIDRRPDRRRGAPQPRHDDACSRTGRRRSWSTPTPRTSRSTRWSATTSAAPGPRSSISSAAAIARSPSSAACRTRSRASCSDGAATSRRSRRRSSGRTTSTCPMFRPKRPRPRPCSTSWRIPR